MENNYQSTEDWQIARENNSNLRCVDVFIATLPRQFFIIETVKSILENPETKSITISASNKYTDGEFQQLTEMLLNINTITQVPIYLHRVDDAKGSNEKLRYIGKGTGKYIALCDDDCVYPPNYFNYLIKGIEKYQGHVTLHGVVLHQRPIRSYYRDRDVYRGLGTVIFDMEVDIAASCMTMFKREWYDDLDTWYDKVSTTSMDDIYVSHFAMQKGIKRFVLSHVQGWVKHKEIRKEDNYVFDKYALVSGGDKVQTDYINTYWK